MRIIWKPMMADDGQSGNGLIFEQGITVHEVNAVTSSSISHVKKPAGVS